jgi:hypothetical protein
VTFRRIFPLQVSAGGVEPESAEQVSHAVASTRRRLRTTLSGRTASQTALDFRRAYRRAATPSPGAAKLYRLRPISGYRSTRRRRGRRSWRWPRSSREWSRSPSEAGRPCGRRGRADTGHKALMPGVTAAAIYYGRLHGARELHARARLTNTPDTQHDTDLV